MSEHPNHDGLLGFAFGLLDADHSSAIAAHVEGCAECAARVEGIGAREAELLDTPKPPLDSIRSVSQPEPFWTSPLVPIGFIAVSLLCSALPPEPLLGLAFAPLVFGAAAVSVWLFALLSRVQSSWRKITRDRLLEELPASHAERALFIEGLRFAAGLAIRSTRAKVGYVLSFGVASGAAGVLIVAVGYVLEPSLASPTIALGPNLLVAAVAFALLFGSAIWAALSLRRFGQRLLDLLNAAPTLASDFS